MSDTNPVVSGSGSIWKRRVAGIPLIYLVGGLVAILAFFAFRMRSTPDEPEIPTGQDQNPDSEADAFDQKFDASYDGFVAKGSITAANPDTATADPVVETNETWLAKAVQWNIKRGVSAGTAQNALQVYLSGADLNFEQSKIRDETIKEFGLPPEPPSITNASPVANSDTVARVQGPLPRFHTVKNTSENTYGKLAAIYYPTADSASIALIRNANLKRLTSDGPFAIGTTVAIPKYSVPKYYTSTKKTDTAKEIAAKNGISADRIPILNPGMKFPVKAGTKVRVG